MEKFRRKKMSISDACSVFGEGDDVGKNELEEYEDTEVEEKMPFYDVKEMTITLSTIKYLSRKGYTYNTRRELPSGKVDILFFSHPDSLSLLKSFPYVVVIDGAYKTKRYGMSLVKIVGYTSTYKPFYIALAFTKEESLPHYLFIMRRLEKLYADLGVKPTAFVTDLDSSLITAIGQVFGDTTKHLFCWIHIKQKIKSYARSVIKKNKDMVEAFTDECSELFSSTTEEMYLERLQGLRDGWNSALVGYIETTWLNPFKENIVRAWTDCHLHFFIASTKRVKMLPSSLKHDLEATEHGLNSIIRIIGDYMSSYLREVIISVNRSGQKYLAVAKSLPPLAHLAFQVTDTCLRMLLEMYYDILKGKISTDCNHQWWRTCYGLPCIHRIERAMHFNTPIMPKEIHSFWRQVSCPRGTWKGKCDSKVNEVKHVSVMMNWWAKFPAGSLCRFMPGFIIDAKYVVADRHCVYRCLALQLGWPEKDYARVRMDIVSELVENKEIYMKITPYIADYDALLENVNSITTPCLESRPIISLAFATRYRVALLHLDRCWGFICLPIKASSGSDKPPEKIMCIASIEGQIVSLWLDDHAPLPPVSNFWRKFKHPSVDGWDDFYYDRIESWRSLMLSFGLPPFLWK